MTGTIFRKQQADEDLYINVQLVKSDGDPDTGVAATITTKLIGPGGTAVAGYTAPTITEPNSDGCYVLKFPKAAATPAFASPDQPGDYLLRVISPTSGTPAVSVNVHISSILPHECSKESSITALAAAVATVDTVVDSILTESESHPTLAEIEASSVLALQSDLTLLVSLLKNKKVIRKETDTWYLCVRNSADSADILKKALKDSTGADIDDLTAGEIAQELLSSV